MDVEKYLETVEKKAGKRSRLEPFISDIAKLREEGCSLEQVREYLHLNGTEISVSGLSAYIQRKKIGSNFVGGEAVNSTRRKNVEENALEKPSGISETTWIEMQRKDAAKRRSNRTN